MPTGARHRGRAGAVDSDHAVFVEVAQGPERLYSAPSLPARCPPSPPKRRVAGITLIGRWFDDGLLGCIGIALQRVFAVSDDCPPAEVSVGPTPRDQLQPRWTHLAWTAGRDCLDSRASAGAGPE